MRPNDSHAVPTVLVVGSSGQGGSLIMRELDAHPRAVHVRLSPRKHHGKDYWMSAEPPGTVEIAAILSEGTGRAVCSAPKFPGDFAPMVASGSVQTEAWYAAGAAEFMRQVHDGRMGYIGSVRDDAPFLTDADSMSFRAWAKANVDALRAIRSA